MSAGQVSGVDYSPRVKILRFLRRNAISLLALFVSLGGTSFAVSRVQQKPAPTSMAVFGSECSPGLDVPEGPPANAEHPDAPLMPCAEGTGKLTKGKYLVLATGQWYSGYETTTAYPTKGRCVVSVNDRILLHSEVSPGSMSEPGSSQRTDAMAIQFLYSFKGGRAKVRLLCAQVQGNFRIASSAVSLTRVN